MIAAGRSSLKTGIENLTLLLGPRMLRLGTETVEYACRSEQRRVRAPRNANDVDSDPYRGRTSLLPVKTLSVLTHTPTSLTATVEILG